MMFLCYSEFLEWSQCNKCCCSHGWGGRHARKHSDHSVRHSINLIKHLTAWLQPHIIKWRPSSQQVCKWCKPRCDDTRCLGNFSVWLWHKSHSQQDSLIKGVICGLFSRDFCLHISSKMHPNTEVTRRDFLCCASHLYWKSYHTYDTSLSSECSISDTSLSSSVPCLSVIDLLSDA